MTIFIVKKRYGGRKVAIFILYISFMYVLVFQRKPYLGLMNKLNSLKNVQHQKKEKENKKEGNIQFITFCNICDITDIEYGYN